MITRVTLLVAALCGFSGCLTTYSIRPAALMALDGFDAATPQGRVRAVETMNGEKIGYAPDAGLEARDATGKVVLANRFKRFEARSGLLLGTTVRNGELSLNPDLFKTVELTVYSPGKTAAMIIVASLIASLPLSIVVMAVAWRGGIGAPFGGHF